jgi:hypothetical protein
MQLWVEITNIVRGEEEDFLDSDGDGLPIRF